MNITTDIFLSLTRSVTQISTDESRKIRWVVSQWRISIYLLWVWHSIWSKFDCVRLTDFSCISPHMK